MPQMISNKLNLTQQQLTEEYVPTQNPRTGHSTTANIWTQDLKQNFVHVLFHVSCSVQDSLHEIFLGGQDHCMQREGVVEWWWGENSNVFGKF